MKITRDTVAANQWCCDGMNDIGRLGGISMTTIKVWLNLWYRDDDIQEGYIVHDAMSIRFCPFCGERLEVEA